MRAFLPSNEVQNSPSQPVLTAIDLPSTALRSFCFHAKGECWFPELGRVRVFIQERVN